MTYKLISKLYQITLLPALLTDLICWQSKLSKLKIFVMYKSMLFDYWSVQYWSGLILPLRTQSCNEVKTYHSKPRVPEQARWKSMVLVLQGHATRFLAHVCHPPTYLRAITLICLSVSRSCYLQFLIFVCSFSASRDYIFYFPFFLSNCLNLFTFPSF